MFTVYTEKETFEEIILYSDDKPNWNNICCNYAIVCLNINDAELVNELEPGSVIFEYVNANGGKQPIALADFFETINDNPSCIAEKPRAAFILNIPQELAEQYQSDFGVLVQSNKSIDDNVLKHHFFRELPIGTVVENNNQIGWDVLFNIPIPPSNCAVISDEYLIKNEENGKVVGLPNLKAIFDTVLPANLKVAFHILIITSDESKTQKQCEQITGLLKATLTSLRPYPIKLEMVFTSALHKRKIFFNYQSVTCDKGFAMFKVSNLKTVRSANDFRSEMLFLRLNQNEGDTVLKSDNILLKEIKKRCDSVKAFINNNGQALNNRIMGDCKADKSIINRLIQEV